jgi:branched-subunit amino acid ABC-type transport system permease component
MFPDQFLFGVEVLLNGLMAGVLYALVALGFVLIFKASGIFNYAQGVMALFAALTLVGIMDGQVPFLPFNQRDFWHGCASFRLARSCLCGHSFGDGR